MQTQEKKAALIKARSLPRAATAAGEDDKRVSLQPQLRMGLSAYNLFVQAKTKRAEITYFRLQKSTRTSRQGRSAHLMLGLVNGIRQNSQQGKGFFFC
jgi:hypothetical protein